jgi:F420-dependent oxidoreductase-like protein
LDVAIMIEGQMGLTWPRWQGVARAVEDLGFAGLYRSDHITNPEPPDQESLELWVSLTWLASHTQRIEFGPLVSPLSFRNPVNMARMASAIDDLSGGRLQLGIGAGWQTREHDGYGFDLLDIPARLQRYREGVEVVSLLLHGDEPVQFEGTFYRLHDAILLPRPQRPGGPPIVIGGGKAVLPLAARFADEWNCGFESPASFARLSARLDELVQQQGRQPGEVRRSLMTMLVFGRDDAELQRKLERQGRSAGELREDNAVVGTGSAVIDQLGELAAAGVQRVMLQWLDLDDLDGLAAFAAAVLPHV